MRNVGIIMRRELGSYFATPLAYVFILIFLLLASSFTFYLGGLYERGQADLNPFFSFHPWLYLFLIPALSMRLWAEERKSGTIELLMTQPITLWQAVLGKFFAAWIFAGLALALTFPLWLTVNYLGFAFLLAGYPIVLDAFRAWLPATFVEAIASLSFLTHFDSIQKGVLDLTDLLYFAMLIAYFLIATAVVLDVRKSE